MLALYSLCIVVLTWPNFRASGGILLTDLKHCMHFWGGGGGVGKVWTEIPSDWVDVPKLAKILDRAAWLLLLHLSSGPYFVLTTSAAELNTRSQEFWVNKPIWSRFLRGNSRSRECRAAECPLVGTPGKCSGSLSAFPGTRERSEVLSPAAAFDKFYLRK